PKGAQAQYCLDSAAQGGERSRLANLAGSVSVQPRISASISVGNFAVTTTATTTQQTSYIYPADNQPATRTWFNMVSVGHTRCVDVSGGNGGAGTPLINFGCKGTADQNQDWSFSVASGDPRYVNILT